MTSESQRTPRPWTDLDFSAEHPADLGLVVLDMDGTLLDGSGCVPEGFWELLPVMQDRGTVVVPASGRQYATLRSMFAEHGIRTYLAENGTVVMHDGEVVSTSPIAHDTVRDIIGAARTVADSDVRLGVVVCAPEVGYVESTDAEFLDEASKYYHSMAQVEDLDAVLVQQNPDVVKVAVFAYGSAEAAAPLLFTGQSAAAPQVDGETAVVISGVNWIDIMNPAANKGAALRELQSELGVPRERTAVFGDYLNDLEMIREGDYSFAMANAHPGITEAANYTAPANTDDGVVRVLRRLLGA
ncbi:MAG: HAD family hydrolase [Mycobacteriaceae bacterium]|uniref:HAD family hydrolase n=1 Tax=Corynebacterium sp. TaxID=1720 RepID=UPI003F9B9336